MYMQSGLMKALFTGQTKPFLEDGEILRRQELGTLALPTGRIVANDPCCFYEKDPFSRTVTPGTYPVLLYVLETQDDKRVAFAAIQFQEAVPQRFEAALMEGQDASALADDEFYGYGVDSGTGGFMDESACKVLGKLFDESEDGGYEPLDEALEKSYVNTYSAANVTLPQGNGNIAAFSSGWGDGSYPSFWGFDEKGQVCCLITDFCIVGDL